MDKETLSTYGWIIIVVIILSILIIFATPFGNTIVAEMNSIPSKLDQAFGINGMPVTAAGYNSPYDGSAHGITVNCDGATITYATSPSGTYNAVKPTYTDVGTYTTYYKVEKDGFDTVTGSKDVVIYKAQNVLALSENSGSLENGSTGTFRVTTNKFGAVLSVTTSDSGVATASIVGDTVTITAKGVGTATITVASAENSNYEAASATYEVTVVSAALNGLFDESDNLIASWNELVNTYGMDATVNYGSSNYSTTVTSRYYVLTNTPALSSGVKLVIGETGSIGNYAFYGCTNLKNIEIPANVTSIGNWVFGGCTNLATVTFAENSQLTSIGIYAFNGCTSLTSIEIPARLTSIDYVFYGCTNLATVTFAENSQLTSIGTGAFYRCASLTSVEIPANVTSIGKYAFSETGLTSIEIPAGVTSIGNDAFSGCTSLTNIEIPAGVTSIGEMGFCDCTDLKTITINSTTALTYSDAMLSGCDSLEAIYVPSSLVDTYKTADGWSNFAPEIKAIP